MSNFTHTVFSLFRADVRIIDAVKRAALSRLLLESVVSTAPGEKLDEKLAAMTLPTDFVERTPFSHLYIPAKGLTFKLTVPPPSTDEQAWWDGTGTSLIVPEEFRPHVSLTDHPNGVFPIPDVEALSRHTRSNPFDSPIDSPLSSSPSSSEDELYTHALSLQTPMAPTQPARKPPPPPPPRRNVDTE